MSSTVARALLAITLLAALGAADAADDKRPRLRDLGITIGVFDPGPLNAITDVRGVRVGHRTVIEGERIRTGVTAIVPHEGNVFQDKTPAAVVVGNGFGKLMGTTQIIELGEIETPILLTNTLAVAQVAEGTVRWTLAQPGNEGVQSVNAVVGETNDGRLNDIRARTITYQHAIEAIEQAKSGAVAEGAVGAGTGTVAFGLKGGIGTSSRRLPRARWQLHGRRTGTDEFRRPADDRGRAGVEAARPESFRAAAADGQCRLDHDRRRHRRTALRPQSRTARAPRARRPQPHRRHYRERLR